ncbi:unnamed protein product [Heligmosomoides polygyrus]|uniref:RAD51 associated protein 1 n=1 Tax=Heligmosomoides polygyrus TaxID=6339 RepID=A0A183G780_HELPZ|nr:unnamed protein product [Heligmosomoides polygyrus]
MGRRKQAKPTKRSPDDFDVSDVEPSAKNAKETLSCSSPTPPVKAIERDYAEMSPSCSKDQALTHSSWAAAESCSDRKAPTSPLLMLERSLKRFEPQKVPPGASFRCAFSTRKK